MSIPVLVVPVVSRFDLLEKMLDSIDYPIDRIVIVENSCNGWSSARQSDLFKIEYIRPIQGLGYGGGINAGILQTCEADWWMFSNADIVWNPGVLSDIDQEMSSATEPLFIDDGFEWGALNRGVVKKIGLIDDQTFYPIYYDDNDYHRRLDLSEIKKVLKIASYSPEGKSTTIRSSEQFQNANNRTFMDNKARYVEKWGGEPGNEVFTTPWDSELPLSYTKTDIDGRRDRQW